MAFSVSGRLLFAGYDDFECKVSGTPDESALESMKADVEFFSRYGTSSAARRSAPYKATITVSAVSVSVMMASVSAQDPGTPRYVELPIVNSVRPIQGRWLTQSLISYSLRSGHGKHALPPPTVSC